MKYYKDVIDTTGNRHKDTYGYRLIGFRSSEDSDGHVLEKCLRKKHKPSEFGSFTNLMDNLKLPQKTPQEVK